MMANTPSLRVYPGVNQEFTASTQAARIFCLYFVFADSNLWSQLQKLECSWEKLDVWFFLENEKTMPMGLFVQG